MSRAPLSLGPVSRFGVQEVQGWGEAIEVLKKLQP